MGLVQPHNLGHHGSNVQSSMAAVALLAFSQVKAQICSLQLAPAQLSLETMRFPSAGESSSTQCQLSPAACFPAHSLSLAPGLPLSRRGGQRSGLLEEYMAKERALGCWYFGSLVYNVQAGCGNVN